MKQITNVKAKCKNGVFNWSGRTSSYYKNVLLKQLGKSNCKVLKIKYK